MPPINPKPEDGIIDPTERMKWAGWIGGLVFILLVVVLALYVPNPTGFQEWAFRVPMSLGASSFAAFVPGFLIIQAFTKKKDRQAGICAGGAIVVFVLLMYVNPTRLGAPAAQLLGTPTQKTDEDPQTAKGQLEILRDFVPRVTDRGVRFSDRSIALATCIDAGVFRGTAAFEKTKELLKDAPENPDEQRLAYPQLVSSLVPSAADNLYLIATEFSFAKDYNANPTYSDQSRAEFWWEVFQNAISDDPDRVMDAIGAMPITEQHFKAMNGLCANTPPAILAKMLVHSSKAVQAMALLEWAESNPHKSETLASIRGLVQAESDSDLLLAAEILHTASRRAIIDPQLALQCFQIMKADSGVIDRETSFDPQRPRGREFRLQAAREYVVWSCQFAQVANQLEPEIVAEVRRYNNDLVALRGEKPATPNWHLHGDTCVFALVSMNSAMYPAGTPLQKRVSADAYEAVSSIADRVHLTNWQ